MEITVRKLNEPKKKIKIETLQQHAFNKGGKLVSTEYINNCTHLLWECEKGHR